MKQIIEKQKWVLRLDNGTIWGVYNNEAGAVRAQARKGGEIKMEIQKKEYDIPETQWHFGPDGIPCCCTAEERQYGVGCR